MKHDLVSYVQEGWIKAGIEAVKRGVLTVDELLMFTVVAATYTGKMLNEDATSTTLTNQDVFFAKVDAKVAANNEQPKVEA